MMLQRTQPSGIVSKFNFKSLLVDFLSKPTSADDKVDVIIFGATGWAGRFTVLEAVNVLKDYKWGVAGRNLKHLEQILGEVSERSRTNLSSVPTFVADLSNKSSLNKLVEKCRVLVNCCGPYHLYAEPVVRACIAAGTHYVDLCTEPHVMEMLQLKYNDEASLQNVCVVPGCGMLSLPVDVGVSRLSEVFPGTINEVDVYMQYRSTLTSFSGPVAGLGSWRSLILSLSHLREIPSIRKRLHRKEVPTLKPKARYKGLMHKSNITRNYCVPFPVFEQQVVERSQYHFFDKHGKRPIQVHSYLSFSSSIIAIVFYAWLCLLALLSQLEYTRNLLLKHPKFFSLGLFSPAGPKSNVMKNIALKYTLHAEGWSMGGSRVPLDSDRKPDKRMMAVISGINPFYGISCCSVLSSAVTILQLKDKSVDSYGVLTPGAAFAKTDLIGELEKHYHGLSFEIK